MIGTARCVPMYPTIPHIGLIIGGNLSNYRLTCTSTYRERKAMAAATSVQELDAKLFDYRVGEHVPGNRVDIVFSLLACDVVVDVDFEELALAHACDGRITEPVERRADGLALRVEHGGLQGHEDASF